MPDAEDILFFAIVGGVILFMAGMVIFPALWGLGFDTMRAPSDYTGQVVDVEHNKGIIFRTSQLKMKTHRRSSSVETFCLHERNHDDQLPLARDALRDGKRVQIEYQRPLFVPAWECAPGTSIVTDIEVVNATDA